MKSSALLIKLKKYVPFILIGTGAILTLIPNKIEDPKDIDELYLVGFNSNIDDILIAEVAKRSNLEYTNTIIGLEAQNLYKILTNKNTKETNNEL